MKQLSLKKKIIGLVLFISMICPVISGIIIYKNSAIAEMYQVIANRSLPRTREMGQVLFKFREVRIQFRSLAIGGNSPLVTEAYLNKSQVAVDEFLKSKDTLIKMMTGPEEEVMISKMEEEWKHFEAFGGQLIELAKKGDEASMSKLSELVRFTCPVISMKFEKTVQDMITWQDKKAVSRTDAAKAEFTAIIYLSISLALLGVLISITVGSFFASNLVKELIRSVSQLSFGAKEIFERSNDVADISTRLSEAATEQAASLQETVASIDEISAMIERNSDSAASAAKTSEFSNVAAYEGKEKVKLMIESISAISLGNNEINEQIKKSNEEISGIITVINEISIKTQVINDIVFQTKLLSFNASVEAARAGEHGKGFAVVAQEVGNLASMSGNAATEISDMLAKSVKRVTDIVDGTKGMMDNLIRQSKDKVDAGMSLATDCGHSLDAILGNVTSVNDLVREISTASREQSSGVKEVNKAMSQLDEVTQQNSSSAQLSSQSASELKRQVNNLNAVVSELTMVVEGQSS